MSFGIRSLFLAYSRLLVFAFGLLWGIQVPSFIDQYEQRVDAHYREVSANIVGFQRTANLMFDGDLQSLIAYYARSEDAVFQRDADSIRIIVDRYTRISAEQAAMQGNQLAVSLHVLFSADRELFDESMAQYNYTVPLNAIAMQWGLALALLLMLSIDGVFFTCKGCANYVRKRRQRTRRLA